MVICLNTMILKSFSIIVLSYYNTTQIMYDTYFFINRILCPITGDVMNTVLYHPSAILYSLRLRIRLYRNASGWYNLNAHG